MKRWKLLIAALTAWMATWAQVRCSAIFSDGMVVQRDSPIPVWGWAIEGQQVTVTLAGTTRTVKADSKGRWKVYMPKMKAVGPYTLRVGQQEIKDVMVGDVFLCSGQSNMELQVKRCMDLVGHKVEGYTNPMVRYVKLPHQYWGRSVL